MGSFSIPATAPPAALDSVTGLLDRLLADCDRAVASIGDQFQTLAQDVDAMLGLTASTLATIQAQDVTSAPARVENLIAATRGYIHQRMQSTSLILTILADEERLLGTQLQLNAANRTIDRESRTLSLLTRMEAARLGEGLGRGFVYLAGELDRFADTIQTFSREMSECAVRRRTALHQGREKLVRALPRIRSEFGAIERSLAASLDDVRRSVQELAACPERFQSTVITVSGHIDGVVSAIQSHDITRQQILHVRDALCTLSAAPAEDRAETCLVLRVQALQLRNIQSAISAWSSRIEACTDSILRVSSTEVSAIAPLVLAQEQSLSAQLLHIRVLERDCARDSGEIDSALAGLSALTQMITVHLEQSAQVRDRMQILSLNSVIEAGNLGKKAGVMLEISRNIGRVAAHWGELTARSADTMKEILRLVSEAGSQHAGSQQAGSQQAGSLEYASAPAPPDGEPAASPGRDPSLRGEEVLRLAEAEIQPFLGGLRTAAEGAAANALALAALTSRLKEGLDRLHAQSREIAAMLAGLDSALAAIEAARAPLENQPIHLSPHAMEQLELRCAASYTTEIERQILRAALYGESTPAPSTAATGNDVELF